MGKNNSPFYNASGCADPTAYYGTKEIIKEETEMEKEVHFLLHIIRDIANMAGFEITNRIHFKHKKTGKEFK